MAKTEKVKDKLEKKLKEKAAKTKTEIAKTMKSEGFKAEQISKITGLSMEAIKRIR